MKMQTHFPILLSSLVIGCFLLTGSLHSCIPRSVDEDSIAEFNKWFWDFYSSVERKLALEDFIEIYHIIWEDPQNGPDLPLSNAGGQSEFLAALFWFESQWGAPDDFSIIDSYYQKKSTMGFNEIYVFELKVNREFCSSKERYVLWDNGEKYKLLQMNIYKIPSVLPPKAHRR